MALEKCQECGGQVSTAAAACPHCGAPIGESSYTTTQATAKKWKIHGLLSLATASVGFAIMAVARDINFIGLTLAIVGLVWLLYARIGAWWHHH